MLNEYPVTGVAATGTDQVLAGRRSSGPRHFRRYLGSFFLLPVLAYLAAFPLVRARSFEGWDPSKWGPVLDFAFNTGKQDADVVVFGDSSAFLGIDPRFVEGQLGLKTLVLPNTIGSLPVVGDRALRQYLVAHRPPRLIVLYFTAWDLDYAQAANRNPFEGEEMLVRHGSRAEITRFAAKHPVEMLLFPLRLYSTFGPDILRSLNHPGDRARNVEAAMGHVDDLEPSPSIDQRCTLPASLLATKGDASVHQLVHRYSTRQTQVMVYLAPVPQCSNTAPLLHRSFPAVAALPPASLPPASFVSDSYFAHMKPDAVPEASHLFSRAVQHYLATAKSAD